MIGAKHFFFCAVLFFSVEFRWFCASAAADGPQNGTSSEFEMAVSELDEALERLQIPARSADDYALVVLRMVAEKGADLLGAKTINVAGRVLKALADGLIPQPDSAEMKAIEQLNENMARKFDYYTAQVTDCIKKAQCMDYMLDYQNNVLIEIDEITRLYDFMMNPNMFADFEEDRRVFVESCSAPGDAEFSLRGIFGVVQYIDRVVRKNCTLPPAKADPNVPEGQSICTHLRSPDKGRDAESSTFWRDHPSGLHVKEKIATTDELFPCFPEAVLRGNRQLRAPLLSFASIVANSLVQLQLHGSSCIGYAKISDAKKKQHAAELVAAISQIAEHMNTWIVQKLELAWPETIQLYAGNVIGTRDVGDEELQRTAEEMAIAAAARGPAGGCGYQVLVWRHAQQQNSFNQWRVFGSVCWAKAHCVQEDRNNLRVLVVRLPDELYVQQMAAAAQWMDSPANSHSVGVNTKRDEIALALSNNLYDTTELMPALISDLDQHTGMLSHFRTVAVLSHTRLFVFDSAIRIQNSFGWAIGHSGDGDGCARAADHRSTGLVHAYSIQSRIWGDTHFARDLVMIV